MTACRTDVENRLYVLLNPESFCDLYKRFEVDIYIILVLRSRVVDQDIYVFYIRDAVDISDVADYMRI